MNDEDKPLADLHTLDKRTLLDDVAQVVEEKRLKCAKKEWKFSRNGKIISTRDILGRVVSWINKFKEVGDIAVQYDPAHATLPWAAVRLVLQVRENQLLLLPQGFVEMTVYA